jgi:hypothetical protein
MSHGSISWHYKCCVFRLGVTHTAGEPEQQKPSFPIPAAPTAALLSPQRSQTPHLANDVQHSHEQDEA